MLKAEKMLLIILLFMTSIKLHADEVPTFSEDSIQQVAILVASSKGIGKSGFGHAYLRLAKNEIWSDDDITVEFVANNQHENIDIFKGMGLNGNYNFAVNFGDYRSTKYFHNNLENRSLTTYPLILSRDQLTEIIKNLNKKPSELEKSEYSFFTKNCATQVSSVIDQVFKKQSGSLLNIPTLLDSKYKDVIDQKNIVIDDSVSIKREKLIVQRLPSLIKNTQHLLFVNITNQLNSSHYSDRILGIMKLINVSHYLSLSSKEQRDIKIFLNLYLILENRLTYKELLKLVNSNYEDENSSYEFIPFINDVKKLEIENNFDAVVEVKFTSNAQPTLKINYRADALNEAKAHKKGVIDIDLSEYDFSSQNNKIIYHETIVSLVPVTNVYNSKNISLNSMTFTETVNFNGKRYIIPYVLIETQAIKKQPINTYANLQTENLLSIKNFNYKGIGNCLSLVMTQKKLLEQVVFVEGSPRLSKEENKILLKKAIAGNFILVPGFTNIWDWSEFIGSENLEQVIGDLGMNININGFGTLISKYFSRIKVSSSNIVDLDLSLSQGVTVPLRFKVENQRAEHAILLYEVVDKGDFYALGFYDPNTGVSSANSKKITARIDKKTGLFYSDLYAQNGTEIYADIMNLPDSLEFRKQQLKDDLHKLIAVSKKINKYYFSGKDLNY